MFWDSFPSSSPTKVVIFAYFPLPILDLLGVDADVTVGDPAVDLVEEIDGVAHRSVEDVGAAIELLGHYAQVLRERFPVITGRIWLFFSFALLFFHDSCQPVFDLLHIGFQCMFGLPGLLPEVLIVLHLEGLIDASE